MKNMSFKITKKGNDKNFLAVGSNKNTVGASVSLIQKFVINFLIN